MCREHSAVMELPNRLLIRWLVPPTTLVCGNRPFGSYSVLRGVSDTGVAAALRVPLGELLRPTPPRKMNQGFPVFIRNTPTHSSRGVT